MTDQQIANPLLARVHMPGETFTLPSGGIFYGEGVLDPSVKLAEVHVHPMTAIDEIVLKSPDMLFSGRAIKEVFQRCIPEILDVDEMLAKDVDFLMVCLRKVSYGDEVQVIHTHDCKSAKEHTYAVSVVDFIKQSRRIDPTSIANFTVSLQNGQTVELRPIKYKDYVTLMQTIRDDITENISPEEQVKLMAKSIANIIVRVDEVTDAEQIRQWLTTIPPMMIKKINQAAPITMSWGPNFTAKVKCKDCGKQMEVMASTNPLYFFS